MVTTLAYYFGDLVSFVVATLSASSLTTVVVLFYKVYATAI